MTGKQSARHPVIFNMHTSKEARFEQLVNDYSDAMYRYAYWLCRNPDMAQDLVQETFARVWKSLDNLRDAAAVKHWLFTIVRREHARQYERYQPNFVDTEPEDLGAAPQDDTRSEAFVLRRALAALSVEYREPLVMQVLGGFNCDEIAAQLGLSRSAVMTRLFRARKQLRLMLTGDENGLREC